LTVARDLDARGVRIVITTLGVDSSTPAGRMVFGVLAQLAEFERATLIERTNVGLAAAKKRGQRLGRRHSLTPHQQQEAKRMREKDGPRQQPRRQFGRGSRPERTQPQPVLQLGGMASTVPLGRQVLVDRVRTDLDLLGNKREKRSRRTLTGPQRTTGIAQVAKHQCLTETIVVAATPPVRGEVRLREREVAHEFALLSRRIIQLRDLRPRSASVVPPLMPPDP